MGRQDVWARDVQIRANGKTTVSPANGKHKPLSVSNIKLSIGVPQCLQPKPCKYLGFHLNISIVNALIKIETIQMNDVAELFTSTH